MGESSTCLMRSFSNSSPTSSEEQKENPLQRALTTSVSFGRFMSESLDWEKWSAFTQNRHLEEVEKYSRPGSVAEKKAYLEAHFMRRRAAALLEQKNVVAGDLSEINSEHRVEYNAPLNSSFVQSDILPETKVEEIESRDPVVHVGKSGKFDTSVKSMLEDVKLKIIEEVIQPHVQTDNPDESANTLENDRCISDIQIEDNLINEVDSFPVNSVPNVMKPEVSSSKLLTNGGSSKCASPVNEIRPVQLENNEKTPQRKSKVMDSSNKRRSYTTSLHMSINLSPRSGAIQKNTSLALQKVEKSRIARAPAKKYKSVFPHSSTKSFANGLFKHQSEESNRIPRTHGNSISEANTVNGKVQPPPSNYSKSSNLFGNRTRTTTVPTTFTFKSEERAVKGREKLEKKIKPIETEKHQKRRAKPQVKSTSTDKDLPVSIAMETTKNAEFPPRNITKKKLEERSGFKVRNNDSRPPWRLSVKTEKSKDSYYGKCFTKKKSMNENTSPNIQL